MVMAQNCQKVCQVDGPGPARADEFNIMARMRTDKMIKSLKVLLVLSTGVTDRVIISGRVLKVDPIFIL